MHCALATPTRCKYRYGAWTLSLTCYGSVQTCADKMVASSSEMSDLDYAVALSLQENCDDSLICINEKTERSDREALDFSVALSLQEEEEERVDLGSEKTKPVELYSPGMLEKKWDRSAIVDSSWELIDPSPDIHKLFCDYDSMFFHSALTRSGVAVSWSDRMKL